MAPTRPIAIPTRSGQPHVGTLTLNGKPMPYLHRNARSRQITRSQVQAVFAEEANQKVGVLGG